MSGELQAIKVVGGVLPAALMKRMQANELSDPASMSAHSYHLVGNEQPRDAAARAWSYLRGGWVAWRRGDAADTSGPGTGLARDRWLLVLLDELGYGRLPAAPSTVIDGTEYPISHRWHHVPIHLLGPRVDLDRRNPGVAGAARAPQAMLQEYLNRTDGDLWGILSNGLRLRLLRDSTAFAGSAYVEFDLEAIFDGELYAEFQLLWLLCHQSRVEKRGGPEAGPVDCWLEVWRAEATEAGTRALERLRDGVEHALREFGTGFLTHPKNDWLRAALHSGSLSDRDYHKALLRLIYRLLFTFVAEDRGALLDPSAPLAARERYAEYFSTQRLRKLSRLRSGGVHPDLWRTQRMVLGGLGGEGMSQLGVPALGGLFDPDRRAPAVEGAPHRDLLLGAELTNQSFLGAIRRLAWIKLPNQRTQAIDYRHLGAEELGGVYESLLELVPRVTLDTREFTLEHLSGNERKTTGSYYTPPALVSALLDSALDPVLDEAVSSSSDPAQKERNLLAVTVCDPASGSGGFLVAAARRIARRLAQARSGEDEPTPEAVQHALHDVVARCIYGVDMNDLAAELAKVSLWLEALEPGKPLGFLDARIRIGNSLFGTTPALLKSGVPNDAFKEIEGDDKKFAASVRKRNAAEHKTQRVLVIDDPALREAYVRERASLIAPTDDLGAIRSRGAAWDAFMESPTRKALELQADAWASAFVWPLREGMEEPPTTGVVNALGDPSARDMYAETADRVDALAREYQYFHWHLEFPEVFGETDGDDSGPDGWAGGFSCMLGNPPWERVKLQEQEFFAARDEQIAKAPNAAARKRLIAGLATGGDADRRLYADFLAERRRSEGQSAFLRLSGRYPLNGRGDVNTYAVFAELFRSLTGPAGRSGVIVPTGIATDATTQYFFKDLVQTRSLAALYDFENAKAIFDGVHRSFKFCILSTSGRSRDVDSAQFAFFLNDPLQVESARFSLTPEEITLLNPNTGTVPIFRTRRDAEITLGIYRQVPVLINENDPVNGNPWGVSFMTMFHMANDSHLFHTRDQLESDGWTLRGNRFERGSEEMLPLYQGIMATTFDHRAADVVRSATAQKRQNQPAYLDDASKQDPNRVVMPMYWVRASDVDTRLAGSGAEGWLLVFRDVTSATNERTLVPAAVPRSATAHKTPLVLGAKRNILYALLSSFVIDYLARQKVGGTSMTYFYLKQFPVPAPAQLGSKPGWLGESISDWISRRVLELSYTAWDMASFARTAGDGGSPFRWSEARRQRVRAELDAMVFRLYGVERREIDYMLDAFPIVRRHDVDAYGEYRTKRLILENYDAMQRCIDEGTTFVSSLDPAPGFGPRHPEREYA